MRGILAVVLGFLMIFSVILLVCGWIGFAVTSWMATGKAELIGWIILIAAGLGELGVYFFPWAREKMDKTDPDVVRKWDLK
jgi:ammonia channel protein AmtB